LCAMEYVDLTSDNDEPVKYDDNIEEDRFKSTYVSPKRVDSPIDLCSTGRKSPGRKKVGSPIPIDFDISSDEELNFELKPLTHLVPKIRSPLSIVHPLKRSKTMSSPSVHSKGFAIQKSASLDISYTSVNKKVEREKLKMVNKRKALEIRIGQAVLRGKHVNLELRVCMENNLFESCLGHEIRGYCIEHEIEFVSKPADIKGLVWFEHLNFKKAVDNANESAVAVDMDRKLPVVDSSEKGSILCTVLFCWEKRDFIEYLVKDESNYVSMRNILKKARIFWTSMSKSGRQSEYTKNRPKIILILEGITEEIVTVQKNQARALRAGQYVNPIHAERINMDGLHDCLTHLFTSEACEHRITSDIKQTSQLFSTYCGSVSASLHYVLPSLLEVSASYKAFSGVKSLQHEAMDDAVPVAGSPMYLVPMKRTELMNTWVSQLRCLLSENKARTVSVQYPTLRSLLNKYHSEELTAMEKEILLVPQIGKSLSRSVYLHYTLKSPDRIILGPGSKS